MISQKKVFDYIISLEDIFEVVYIIFQVLTTLFQSASNWFWNFCTILVLPDAAHINFFKSQKTFILSETKPPVTKLQTTVFDSTTALHRS